MPGIVVKADASDVLKALTAAAKQVNYASAVALTRTAQAVKAAQRAEMQRVFISAVPFTLNSIYVTRAERTSLVSSVGIKDQGKTSALSWLIVEIEGGARNTGIEVFLRPLGLPPSGMFAVPGSEAPKSGSGKLNIGALQRIISQLQSQPPGAQSFQAIKRKKGRGSTKAQYFYLEKKQFGLPPGIFAVKGRAVLPVIIFVKRPTYRAKFDFYGVAKKTAESAFPGLFSAALDDALSSAR